MIRRPFWIALIFERNGDLNLTWLFLTLYAVMGLIACGVVLVTVPLVPVMVVAVFAFLQLGVLTFTISAVPIARAKILAESKVLEAAAKTLTLEGHERLDNDQRDPSP